MKTQSSFIRSDGIVKLNPVTQVYMDRPLVVGPGYLENQYAIGFDDPVHNIGRAEMGILIVNLLDRFQDLANGLVVLHLTGVLLRQVKHDGIYIHCSVSI